jgi:hypothetical protein
VTDIQLYGGHGNVASDTITGQGAAVLIVRDSSGNLHLCRFESTANGVDESGDGRGLALPGKELWSPHLRVVTASLALPFPVMFACPAPPHTVCGDANGKGGISLLLADARCGLFWVQASWGVVVAESPRSVASALAREGQAEAVTLVEQRVGRAAMSVHPIEGLGLLPTAGSDGTCDDREGGTVAVWGGGQLSLWLHSPLT